MPKNQNEPEKDVCSEVIDSAREEKLAEQQIVKETIEEKNRQIASYHDQILRVKADFENYRKRVEKEKQEYLAWGKIDILMQTITLLDVIQQALVSAHSTRNVESVVYGLELIEKEFNKFLKAEGVEPISTKKIPFDPHLHEAVAHIPSDHGRDGEIVGELQRGYRFKNKVIRPARVQVAKVETNKNKSEDLSPASKTDEKGQEPSPERSDKKAGESKT